MYDIKMAIMAIMAGTIVGMNTKNQFHSPITKSRSFKTINVN